MEQFDESWMEEDCSADEEEFETANEELRDALNNNNLCIHQKLELITRYMAETIVFYSLEDLEGDIDSSLGETTRNLFEYVDYFYNELTKDIETQHEPTSGLH